MTCKNGSCKSREEMRDYQRKYRHRALLGQLINGKLVFISCEKRPYSADETCEICGKQSKKLNYHHWQNFVPRDRVIGLWLCYQCHNTVHLMQRNEKYGIYAKYLSLKDSIINTHGVA